MMLPAVNMATLRFEVPLSERKREAKKFEDYKCSVD